MEIMIQLSCTTTDRWAGFVFDIELIDGWRVEGVMRMANSV